MGLDIWFPLAVYFEDVEDGAAQNPRLLARIRELMAAAGAPRTSPTASWTGDVHNVDRLHLDPTFDWLTEQVGLHALRYLKTLGHNLEDADVYIQRAWPVVARRDQRVSRHAHHTAHLSAVYYVAAPSDGDPGQIRFLNDSRPNELSSGIGSNMTRGYSEFNALNYDSALYSPIPGRLLLFPAKQTHAVEPNQTDEERISVSYDMVITSRGNPEGGHHEFLMPAPSVWKRVARAETETAARDVAPAESAEGAIALASLTGHARPFDRFAIPERDGHVLWTPMALDDCSSPAAWQEYSERLAATAQEDWLRDHSAAVWLWHDCADWQAYRDAIDRVYVHLRDREAPLDGANLTKPILQKRHAGEPGAFRRGKAHLCLYLRLDRGDGECQLEFAEGGAVGLAPGGLLVVSGFRRHRLTGESHVLHFQMNLPALARPDALSLRALQLPEVEDYVVFAAIAAQPLGMALPSSKLLQEKFDWIERRRRQIHRHESCPEVRRFLLEHADPATASDAELGLIHRHGLGGADTGRLLARDSALDAEQCAALRRYADVHMTSVTPDTVDGLPEYQVNLTADTLREIVGHESAEALMRLPTAIGAPPDQAAERTDIFLRKYSPRTRPYITFHADNCSHTLNIALTDDESFKGGRLLALHDGALKDVPRRLGAAVLHAGNLVHGVSRIEQGARYSLIMFFHHRDGAAQPAAR